jgi:predicted RNase H-like HicB family nuclease
MRKSLTVYCAWDAEAGVWYVEKSDVPGLVAEAETVELMNELLRQRIPELLVLNTSEAERRADKEVPWELIARRHHSFAFAG